MKRSPLEHIKHLIKKLSAEDKQKIIPCLAQFSDSGVQSYDLSEEFEALKKHGQTLPPEGNPTGVSLTFIRDVVEVHVADRKVAHARFFPQQFEEAFPDYINQTEKTASGYKENLLKPETKAKIYAQRAANGIVETEAECEAAIIAWCDDTAKVWVPEKSKRIAEKISRHFPGMIMDMMIAAIKGQTFYDLHEATKQLSPDKPLPSVKGIKKAVQDIAWRDLKPHLPSTKYSRTPQDWRGDEVLKSYAELVNERHPLTTRIKDVFTECDEAEDWIEDLREDSNFQKLSAGINKDALKRAIRRTADSNLPDRERRPLAGRRQANYSP